MPFVGESEGWWRPSVTVDLRQLPERRRLTVEFEVLEQFGHTDRPPDGHDGAGPTWSREAVEHVVPAGFVTDLASVPALLWGVIASYGRQTLPAVLHDTLYLEAAAAGSSARARRMRREADALFRSTLRETGAGPVRQWLMWAAVRTFGSPVVVVPLVVLAVVLLTTAGLDVAGLLTVPVIGRGAALVAAVGLLAALAIASVEEARDGHLRWRPDAFASLAVASLVALVATPPVLVVIVVTAVVRAVVELGERPAVVAEEGYRGRPAATARITWSPLLSRPAAREVPPQAD